MYYIANTREKSSRLGTEDAKKTQLLRQRRQVRKRELLTPTSQC